MLILGDRVHSNNYGYGTIIKITSGSYPMVTIKLEGLLPWFNPAHIVHCDLQGHRDYAYNESDPEVDFFVVYPEHKSINIQKLQGLDPQIGPELQMQFFNKLICNKCNTQWIGTMNCPECHSTNISDLIVWRESCSKTSGEK